MDLTNFKWQLNLKKLSLVSVSALLWETPSVKEKMKNCCLETENKTKLQKSEKRMEVMEMILRLAQSLHLPSKLFYELQIMVVLTGEKVYTWFLHTIEHNIFHLTSFSKLCWTVYGTIDGAQILKKISDKSLNFLSKESSANADLSCLFKTGPEDLIIQLVDNFVHKSVLENFFSCISSGHLSGAFYFYKKLKDKQSIHQKALDMLFIKNKDDYLEEKKIPLLLIFFNNMTEEQRKEIILKNFYIYSILLKSWPYAQLSMEVLNYWENLDPKTQKNVFEETLNFIGSIPMKEVCAYMFIYQPILENILKKFSEEGKLKFFDDLNSYYIRRLFEECNFLAINTIIRDSDLLKHRSKLLDMSDHLKNYLRGDKNDKNSYYIKKLLKFLKLSDDEKRMLLIFSNDTGLLNQLLFEGSFNSAEDVIEWNLYLKGENVTIENKKKVVKESVNHLNLCYRYIKNFKYYLLEKFFKWKYNDMEEIENVETEIFSWDFITQSFWELWMKSELSKRTENCSIFIKYFFKTKSELSWFRRTMVEDKKFLSDIRYTTVEPSHLDEIFEVFLVSKDKVCEIKEKIKKNINWWFDTYGNQISFLNGLIQWICNDLDEMKIIIQSRINSSEGALFCFNVLSETWVTAKWFLDSKNILLHQWIARYGDVKRIIKAIEELEGSLKIKNCDLKWVIDRFRLLGYDQ